MTKSDFPEPTAEQAVLLQRARRMMLVAGVTTALAIAAVVMAIGYRLFRSEGSGPMADVATMLPKGALITATAAAGDRLVITLDVGGQTEIRTFDAHSMKPTGRLKFANEP